MRKVITIVAIIILVSLLVKALSRQDINFKFLQSLNPISRRKFVSFLNEIKLLGYTPVIRDARRSYEQQKVYHDQDKRNAVAGHSTHETGDAIDMDLHKDGKILSKKTPKAIWNNTGVPELAKKYGIFWGGDFKGYADNNHFQSKT